MLWSCFQALVILFQNRYQLRRMYTRIAMGKTTAMDVVSGESSGSSGQLLMLYPFIIGGWGRGGRYAPASHSCCNHSCGNHSR